MMLGGVFRVHCIFPYLEGEVVLNEKRPINIVWCCIQGPGYMFKRGNPGDSNEKIVERITKIQRGV
jgi:hypothetical protein